MFFYILFSAHLLAVIVPIFLGIKSFKKFRSCSNYSFIPFGFLFLGLASMFEMIDHTQTDWIYIEHSSFYNFLFYSSLSLGLTSLSISVIKNKFTIVINLLLPVFLMFSYLFFSKTIAIFFQMIISIFLIINWTRIFKDWLFIIYPIFGILFTTLFGTNLVISGNQIWHVLIGPSGTISAITFFLVLNRYEKKIKC